MIESQLRAFVRESNRIEGILRRPKESEVEATRDFLALTEPRVIDVEGLVSAYQPGAILRREAGLNVRVGRYIAPLGGPEIAANLVLLLANLRFTDPWETHLRYECLHPFTDGNGRSGRAIWAWQMLRRQEGLPLGFLHQFYYQTLERVPTALRDGER